MEPTGSRPPRLSDLPRAAARLRRRLRRGPSGPVDVVSPLSVGIGRGRWAASLAAGRLRRLVLKRATRAGLCDPVLWVGAPSPEALLAVEGLAGTLVYDCIDDLASLRGEPALTRAEDQLARRAELVVATSARLLERMKRLNSRCHLVPNGCELDHFSRPLSSEVPGELARLPRPILGYVGEVAEWLDTDALAGLARCHAGGSVVLVGPVRSDEIRRRLGLPNVHLLGARDYDSIPDYVGRFDICLIPFRISSFTESVNPVKLYEYLAAGRPVVSTPLPEVALHSDLVAVAEGGRLHEAVAAVLSRPDTERDRARRRRFAAANTWDLRVERIASLLADAAPTPGTRAATPLR